MTFAVFPWKGPSVFLRLQESVWTRTSAQHAAVIILGRSRNVSNVHICLLCLCYKWAIFQQKPTRQAFHQMMKVRKTFFGSPSGSEGRGHAAESDMHSWSEATAGPGKHAPCGRNDVAARGHRWPLTPLFAHGSKNHIDFGSP